jgi:hypothetical protein
LPKKLISLKFKSGEISRRLFILVKIKLIFDLMEMVDFLISKRYNYEASIK